MATRKMKAKLWKLAAVVAVVGSLAMTGASPAVAEAGRAPDEPSPLACGGQVFLDGIRALRVSDDPGGRDEVKIVNARGVKIWPVTAPYVSIGQGQRVEVDKCVPTQARLRLIEVDDLNPDDLLGRVRIRGQVTRNYVFCCGGGARYRIGAIA